MKRLIYVLLTLFILTIFLYVQSQYNIDSGQLERDLSEYIQEDITITQQAPLQKTSSTYFLFKRNESKGLAILTKHRWRDKWKIELVYPNLSETFAQVISTNRGNYIVANGQNFSEQVMMNDGKSIEMELLNQEMPIYISKSTIAKKYVTSDIEKIK